jgi:RecJ-like exonuclease
MIVGRYKNSNGLEFQRRFIENSVNCGECNGEGKTGRLSYCRGCDGYGIAPFYEFSRGAHEADLIELGVLYTHCVKLLKSHYAIN